MSGAAAPRPTRALAHLALRVSRRLSPRVRPSELARPWRGRALRRGCNSELAREACGDAAQEAKKMDSIVLSRALAVSSEDPQDYED
eukprot:10458560-Alexandrium_andersonii.AAC.1